MPAEEQNIFEAQISKARIIPDSLIAGEDSRELILQCNPQGQPAYVAALAFGEKLELGDYPYTIWIKNFAFDVATYLQKPNSASPIEIVTYPSLELRPRYHLKARFPHLSYFTYNKPSTLLIYFSRDIGTLVEDGCLAIRRFRISYFSNSSICKGIGWHPSASKEDVFPQFRNVQMLAQDISVFTRDIKPSLTSLKDEDLLL